MTETIIFGGTSEGRHLAEYCAAHQIEAVVTVVSDYGCHNLPQSPYLKIITKSLQKTEIEELIGKEQPKLIIDATHPYASVVTGYVEAVCDKIGMERIRVVRTAGKKEGIFHSVKSVSEAVNYLKGTEGNILVTTGSKELEHFTALPDYKERLYVRILPSAAVLETCEKLGIRGKHIIAMQGPFSREINLEFLKQTGAKYLITKEAGEAGGFEEKLKAAVDGGVTAVVIGRPISEVGVSVEAAEIRLLQLRETDKISFHVIGIGMGGRCQLTLEAVDYLKRSDVIFGAPRILRGIEDMVPHTLKIPQYTVNEILIWLEKNTEYHEICIAVSGDPGFYSGAQKITDIFRSREWKEKCRISVTPGISSLSYLCAKIGIGWEDIKPVSSHGRTCDLEAELKEHKKVFLLLGGENGVGDLCRILLQKGYGDALLTVGEQLSYPDERVETGMVRELSDRRYSPLSVVLIDTGKEGIHNER